MWAGDRLFFHPQLSLEPSKLIAGQLVCMLNYCSLQKKKKILSLQTKHPVRKLLCLCLVLTECGDEPKSNHWNELLKSSFPHIQ